MNQEFARRSKENSLKQATISFDNIPHQSKIFLDFQSDLPALDKFYPRKNTRFNDFACEVLENYQINRRELCDVLEETNKTFGADSKTFENIKLLLDADSVAVVTGQQAGLFSGELYTIYKALSAVRLAEDLRRENIKAVPVFWIAEEDHDFDEVKKIFVLDEDGKLAKVENTPRDYTENVPVGAVILDETIGETIRKLFDALSPTEFSSEAKNLLLEYYKSGETYSTAFAKFLTKLFAGYGLIFIAPLDEKLKQLCSPIFVKALEKSDEINAALLEKNLQLESQNYQPQVLVVENSFPFFYQNETGVRQAIRHDLENSKFKIQNLKLEFSRNELLEIAANSPQNLSPNALLRPVVQDFLLPTLAYIGGAAEIAYFAQNSAIYKILKRPVTPIKLRTSLTIIQAKHARTLEKYDLKFTDLFFGKEKILSEIIEKFISKETAETFFEVEKNIGAQLDLLEKSLIKVEPTLAANLANRRRKVDWHISALRKKYHLAGVRKDETMHRRIENLFTAVLPRDALQERTLNALTFLNIYGTNLISWIYEATDSDEKNHQILYY